MWFGFGKRVKHFFHLHLTLFAFALTIMFLGKFTQQKPFNHNKHTKTKTQSTNNNKPQDAPPDIRLMRRIQRHTVERGHTLPEIIAQYSATATVRRIRRTLQARCQFDRAGS